MRRKNVISSDARRVTAAREQRETSHDEIQVPNVPLDHNAGPCDSTTNDMTLCQPSV